MTMTTAHRTPSAAPCLSCGTTGGSRHPRRPGGPTRTRGLCSACYIRAHNQALHGDYPACGTRPVPYQERARPATPAPIPATAVVTPAMLGCRPGQPPTDPGCTPDRVWQIANTNTRRALQWLARHTDLDHPQALALAVWEPAACMGLDDAAQAA